MSSIGRYRVVARLGAGAFSTVWLGHDDELDVDVAIKVLAENWVGHADVVQRFLDEARLLRRVEDRRVVRVHDIGRQADGRPYFVMDHVDGGTLADLTDLPLAPTEALDLGGQLAEAVQVLHDHGVLHRDLKPSNVLLTPGPARRVVVADLGMAKRLAESSGVTLTVGTPAFMAPEQAHQRSGLDVRADVYGVAAVTYLLLTGRRPFPGSSSASEVALRDPGLVPDPVRPGPRGVDAVLRAALAYDPEQRPATARLLADRLHALRANGSDASDEVVAPTATDVPRGLGRPAVVGVSLSVALVVAVATWVVLSALLRG
ncbi:MAG TPA: serine/threonine-protein kinase [Friedmanniella sp.]